MTRPIRPFIIVRTSLQEIDVGQMLTVSARLFNESTLEPVVVSRIFMQIQARNGIEVWPLEVVRKNAAGFDILIGTSEMKAETEYLIRVSNNWSLSPIGTTKFKTKKKLDPALLPLIPIVPFPIRVPVHDIPKGTVKEFIFRTQMDHRVCPICKGYENLVFAPNVWKPTIPDDTHPRCRCTYDVIFKTKEEQELSASMKEIAEVAKIAKPLADGVIMDAVHTVEAIEIFEQKQAMK